MQISAYTGNAMSFNNLANKNRKIKNTDFYICTTSNFLKVHETCWHLNGFLLNEKCSVWSGATVGIQMVQKWANLVELEKYCKTHIFLQTSVSIQPRTSPPKIWKIWSFRSMLPNATKISRVAARRYRERFDARRAAMREIIAAQTGVPATAEF